MRISNDYRNEHIYEVCALVFFCSMEQIPFYVRDESSHRFVCTSGLSLTITSLPLLAATALEGVGFGLLLSSCKRVVEILLIQQLVCFLQLVRGHFLQRMFVRKSRINHRVKATYRVSHLAEPLDGEITRNDSMSQTWVVLVLKVQNEASYFGSVIVVSAAVFVVAAFFDGLCAFENLLRCCMCRGERRSTSADRRHAYEQESRRQ